MASIVECKNNHKGSRMNLYYQYRKIYYKYTLFWEKEKQNKVYLQSGLFTV